MSAEVTVAVVGGAFLLANTTLGMVVSKLGRQKTIKAVEENADRVHAQLMPNGGTSARDSLDRVERSMSRLTEEMVDIRVGLAYLNRRVERLDD